MPSVGDAALGVPSPKTVGAHFVFLIIFLIKLDFQLGMPAGGLPFCVDKKEAKNDLRGFAP